MAIGLMGAWLGARAASAVRVLDQAAVAEARERTREVGREVGLVGERLERLVSAVSELAGNQLVHGRGGLVAVSPTSRGDVPGVEVIAADRGPGIADPTRALAGAPERSSGSLGVGVSAARRQVDELDVDVRLKEGTCFWARKFASPVARRPEVGIFGVPCAGERVSGDDAMFARTDAGLVLAVADGLGHGAPAREASCAIIDGLRASPSAHDLVALFLRLDALARETRGAALTVLRVDEATREVECAAVGNVVALLADPSSTQHFGGSSWTVGGKSATPKPVRPERAPGSAGAALVIFSDGCSRSAVPEPSGLREHPLAIAHAIAKRYGRSNDDVTVLVAR
ncbi:MAG: SpoIIE family protein phosphatase [Polyangiaceae bacterium]|nr:SpoIIE family protein phosphatase [Polyangiaceae bacterium]